MNIAIFKELLRLKLCKSYVKLFLSRYFFSFLRTKASHQLDEQLEVRRYGFMVNFEISA